MEVTHLPELTRLVTFPFLLKLSNAHSSTMNASPHFLLLASHLLEALTPNTRKLLSPDELTAADAALAQLHVVFGPMLISALQLVDRREGKLG